MGRVVGGVGRTAPLSILRESRLDRGLWEGKSGSIRILLERAEIPRRGSRGSGGQRKTDLDSERRTSAHHPKRLNHRPLPWADSLRPDDLKTDARQEQPEGERRR